MTARDLMAVDPMMVRKFTPTGAMIPIGGVLVLDTFDVEDVGLALTRFDFDEAVVDCSRRVFDITNRMIVAPVAEMVLTVFPSRRWRNFRTDQQIDEYPDRDHPLLYLGNPIRLIKDARGIAVERRPEFLIKSGMELGF